MQSIDFPCPSPLHLIAINSLGLQNHARSAYQPDRLIWKLCNRNAELLRKGKLMDVVGDEGVLEPLEYVLLVLLRVCPDPRYRLRERGFALVGFAPSITLSII